MWSGESIAEGDLGTGSVAGAGSPWQGGQGADGDGLQDQGDQGILSPFLESVISGLWIWGFDSGFEVCECVWLWIRLPFPNSFPSFLLLLVVRQGHM